MKTTHLSTRKSGDCALFENATRSSRLIAFGIPELSQSTKTNS